MPHTSANAPPRARQEALPTQHRRRFRSLEPAREPWEILSILALCLDIDTQVAAALLGYAVSVATSVWCAFVCP